MAEQFCIPVEYCYKRKPIPKSRLWHMNCYKAAERSSSQVPEVFDVSDAGGDQVSIFIAVPCGERGEVDVDTLAEHQELANQNL
jgi:hypothetical protein